MPDKSKAQKVAMNIAKGIQAGKVKPKRGTPSAGIAASMKPSDLADFGGPAQPGLPQRVPPAPPTPAPRPSGMKMVNTPTGSLAPVPGTMLGGKK